MSPSESETPTSQHRIAVTGKRQRLDRWLCQHFPAVPRSRLLKLLRKGQIRVGERRASPQTRVAAGDTVAVPALLQEQYWPAEQAQQSGDPQALHAAILHREAELLALNKPAGLAVQGGKTLDRHLAAQLPALQGSDPKPPRLVHRLDKATSGVLLLARTAGMADWLIRAFQQRRVAKTYWALVYPTPEPRRGTIRAPLAKGPAGKMQVAPRDGDAAVTHYRVLSATPQGRAWVELQPTTGRTHQLRVHLAHAGTPVIGDRKYGDPAVAAPQLMFHARQIAWPQRDRDAWQTVTAPPPEPFERWLAPLRAEDTARAR